MSHSLMHAVCTGMEFTTLHSIDTEYSADSIEWCPHPEYRSYFVCGTYQLEENEGDTTAPPCRRKGRIYLFVFHAVTKELSELQRLETAAILDMKWLYRSQVDNHQRPAILATANALGQIDVYELKANKLTLRSSLNLNPENESLLALSLDWNWPSSSESDNQSVRQILTSDSKGEISIIEYAELEGKLDKLHTWPAHSYEAWICAFDKWDPHRVYTGGDDLLLHAYDLRSYDRLLTNKSHAAGVTCLLSHPKREHLLLTGSYDEYLRIFDTRAMKQPLGQLNLNGGIWRLRLDPLNRDLILAACMYKNFSIVQLQGDNLHDPKLLGEYDEHKSICYGADWCQNLENDGDEMYMATCSFYDHKLCIAGLKPIDEN